MSQPEIHLPKPLDESQALDLWKYLQDRADQIKERMWTITGWLFALLTGLLGVIADECMELGPSRIVKGQEQPWLGTALGVASKHSTFRAEHRMNGREFNELTDALGKRVGGLVAIVTLPNTERKTMRQTLDRTYRLIDTTLNAVTIRLDRWEGV